MTDEFNAIFRRRSLSPCEVKALLHIYAIAEPLPHEEAPAVASALKRFICLGAVIQDRTSPSGYRTTTFGDAWAAMICSTPAPEEAYVDPRTKELIATTQRKS